MTKFPNLKPWSPSGDICTKRKAAKGQAFPHQIKKAGVYETPASYIPATSLKEMTGLPTPVETRVAPGLGAAGPSGRKSVAWKAYICKDETASMAPFENKQMANVTTVGTTNLGMKSPSKFAATVGPRGPQGVNTGSDGEHFLFSHTNMRGSTLDGPGGVSARSSKHAATVRTAPGKQITTKEETFGGRVLKNKKVRNI